MIDKKKIEKAVYMMLEAMDDNPKREGLKNTPRRVADFYEEALAGMSVSPKKVLDVCYEQEQHEELVLLKGIPFHSLCEHHLLPFYGKVHVAYIPNRKRLLGISKIARVVEMFSQRLQLQERLTNQIVTTLMETIKPLGVIVIIEAEHLCMTMRGIKKPGTTVTTSSVRGIFLKDAKTRAEAMSLIKS
jgi:GTP cyclohydrolase IA